MKSYEHFNAWPSFTCIIDRVIIVN